MTKVTGSAFATKQRRRLGAGIGLRRFVITISLEDGTATRRESHLALWLRASIFDFDKAVYERVLPYGMSRARTTPRLGGLVKGSMTARDPGKELYH